MHTLRAALDRVDWNFEGSSTPRFSPHLIHWFAGNFIPQIPAYLVELLSKPGDVVLDPFCGSGTTGVEAIRLGRPAIMSDVNRAGILITAGKLALVTEPTKIGREAALLREEFVFDALLRIDAEGSGQEGVHPDLKRWFHAETLAQLRYLWTRVASYEHPGTRAVLKAVFSDVLFACASTKGAATKSGGRRRHHWGWIADNVLPKQLHPHNAIHHFRLRLVEIEKISQALEERPRAAAFVVRQDARALGIAADSVDLIVTSPPYLAMIDYTLGHRLTHLWMGWDMERDRELEVGARFRRNRRDAEASYEAFFVAVSAELRRVLRPGGFCAVVLGGSRKYPKAPHAAFSKLGGALEIVWGPTVRTPSRRRVSERGGTDPNEFVCVLKK